jgi:hypothetical protein
MQAYPDKFQVIAVGKVTNEHFQEFQIDNVTIKCEDCVKLLG